MLCYARATLLTGGEQHNNTTGIVVDYTVHQCVSCNPLYQRAAAARITIYHMMVWDAGAAFPLQVPLDTRHSLLRINSVRGA